MAPRRGVDPAVALLRCTSTQCGDFLLVKSPPTSKAGCLGSACHGVSGCGYRTSQVRGQAVLGMPVLLVTCWCTRRWKGQPEWPGGPQAVSPAGGQPALAPQLRAAGAQWPSGRGSRGCCCDPCPYATFAHCHQASVGPSAGTGQGWGARRGVSKGQHCRSLSARLCKE